MFRMKIYAVMLLVMLGITPVSFAAGIGYVDINRLMKESSPQQEKIVKTLAESFGERKKELEEQSAAFQAMQIDFEKNRTLLSQEESEKRAEELFTKDRELRFKMDAYNEDYRVASHKLIDELEKKVVKIIEQIAKKKGLELVVTSAAYSSKEIDLTSEVAAEVKKL